MWRALIDVVVSYSVKVRMKFYGRRADVETFRMMKDHRNGQYRCVFGDFFLPRHHCLTALLFAWGGGFGLRSFSNGCPSL